jgi:hypothetical protein
MDEGKHRGARRLLCRTEGKREGEGEWGADTARGHRARRGGSDMDARLGRDRAAGGGQFRQRQATVGQKFRGCSNPSRPRCRCRRPRSHQWPTRPRRPRRRATGTWRTPLTRPPTTRHPPTRRRAPRKTRRRGAVSVLARRCSRRGGAGRRLGLAVAA